MMRIEYDAELMDPKLQEEILKELAKTSPPLPPLPKFKIETVKVTPPRVGKRQVWRNKFNGTLYFKTRNSKWIDGIKYAQVFHKENPDNFIYIRDDSLELVTE
jgi:hypothetical protein